MLLLPLPVVSRVFTHYPASLIIICNPYCAESSFAKARKINRRPELQRWSWKKNLLPMLYDRFLSKRWNITIGCFFHNPMPQEQLCFRFLCFLRLIISQLKQVAHFANCAKKRFSTIISHQKKSVRRINKLFFFARRLCIEFIIELISRYR